MLDKYVLYCTVCTQVKQRERERERVWVRVSRNFVDLINQFVPVRNLTRKLESHVNKRGPPGFLGWPIKPSEVYEHTRYRSTGESEIALTSLLEIRWSREIAKLQTSDSDAFGRYQIRLSYYFFDIQLFFSLSSHDYSHAHLLFYWQRK